MGLFTKGPKYVTTDGIREVYPADEKTGKQLALHFPFDHLKRFWTSV